MARRDAITAAEYRALAEFRHRIRAFLNFSERAARRAGIEPRQHQLLLAIKGLPPGVAATIGELAARLHLRHHSAVELVDRAEKANLVRRERRSPDRRRVTVRLTARGDRVLRHLSVPHRAELQAAAPALLSALQELLSASRRGSTNRRLCQKIT